MDFVVASILTWVLHGWSTLTWFQCGGSDLTMVSRKRVHFSVGDRNWYGFMWWSKMTWFGVWIDISFVFVSGHMPNWLAFRVRIGIDFTSVLGSKWTWFFPGDKNWVGFSCRIEIDLLLCRAQNCLSSWERAENSLWVVWTWKVTDFSVKVELNLISVWGSNLKCFYAGVNIVFVYECRKLPTFMVSI